MNGRSLEVAMLASLVGCTLGPEFHAPAAPQLGGYTAEPMPAANAGGEAPYDRSQAYTHVTSLPSLWWSEFGSAELDALVARALSRNPTIAAADAALLQAQETAAAQRGTFAPSLQASYAPVRARVSDAVASPLSSGASLYTLHTGQLSVSYGMDVFGANRRTVESLDAQSESQAWQWRAARLSLAANVVNAALQLASLTRQLQATERIVAIGTHQLELLQTQRRLGAAAGAAVYAQEALVSQSEVSAAALRKQLAQQRDLLAVLLGDLPSEHASSTLDLMTLRLPDVPLTLPGRLVDQRPDVRAALAQLHAADAQVGVAAANMLPQITLTGNYGASAEAFADLFKAAGLMWALGLNLTQPVFEGGTLQHRKRAAEAQARQAMAQYQSTVLNAFQNVADALEATRHDADQYLAARRQELAAEALLRIAQRQLQLGDISYLVLLNAQSTALQATVSRIQAHASRFSDTVAVYQALGGGWDEPPGANEH
ncbi:MAG TPA: efflux transporter outer membrane subunit [Burkholderiaceae bacterium]